MKTAKKKKQGPKVKGIAVQIMTWNKGLYQRFFEGLKEEDLVWLEVSELYEPKGGRDLHTVRFTDKDQPSSIEKVN